MDCSREVCAMTRRDGSDVMVKCGSWFGGIKLICDPCMEKAQKEYPQGWRYYPGDVCKHGRYVGGCGADYLCPACEFGDDE